MPSLTLSLRQRLLLLTALALVPGMAVLGYTEWDLRRAREAEVHELALRMAVQASGEMERIVGGAESLLLSISYAPAVASLDPEECGAYLTRVGAHTPNLVTIAAVDRAGRLACGGRGLAAEDSLDRLPVLHKALRTGRFQLGGYDPGKLSERPSLTMAMPLLDDSGEVAGAVVAGLDLQWMEARLRERGLGRGDSLTIADRDGVIISRMPYPERFIGTRIPEAFMRLVHAERPGSIEVTSQDGTRRILGYTPAATPPIGIYVSAGISRAEAFAPINLATRRSIALMLIGSAVAFAAAWLAGSRFIGRPVDRLLATIRRWRDGDMGVRTGMNPEAGELEAVGAAFDELVEAVGQRQAARQAAERHRDLLVEELKHRVKNTLAVVQSIAGQTFRNAAIPPNLQAAFFARLTALAAAHELLTAQNWQSADIRDVIDNALRLHCPQDRDCLRLEGPALRMQPRAALALSMALHELATNAAKYGALTNPAGTIAVRWSVARADGAPRFRLGWTEHGGPPPQKLDRKPGFGSRLVRALATELRGEVRLDYLPSGAVCTVDAPLDAVEEPASRLAA